MNKKTLLISMIFVLAIFVSGCTYQGGDIKQFNPFKKIIKPQIQKCSDGTLYNSCSTNKPQYCSSSGSLTNKCSTCGCNTGETCQADGTCKLIIQKQEIPKQIIKTETQTKTEIKSYTTNSQTLSFVPGEIIVKFKEIPNTNIGKPTINPTTTGISSIDSLNKRFSVSSIKREFPNVPKFGNKVVEGPDKFGLGRIYKFSVPVDTDILSIVKEYQQDPNVEYAEPSYIPQLLEDTPPFPNDPFYRSNGTWNQSFLDQWWLQMIGVDEKIWKIANGTGVVIGLPDSGSNFNHEDLLGQFWINENEIPNNNIDDDYNGWVDDYNGLCVYWTNPDPPYGYSNCSDSIGHGTAISGQIAALTNNNKGIASVAFGSKIMILIINEIGIKYAIDNGAKIITMSWTGRYNSLEDLLEYANDKGVLLVSAAGNNNAYSFSTPGSFPMVINVAGTQWENDVRYWSSGFGELIDVAAPGADILTTRLPGDSYYGIPINDNYTRMWGTSFASPIVASEAALLLSKYPYLTNGQVRYLILNSADDKGEKGWDQYYGYGRINVTKAFILAKSLESIPEWSFDSRITYPRHKSIMDALLSGETSIIGTATSPYFSNYTLELCNLTGYDVPDYENLKCTIIKYSNKEVINGTLAILNMKGLQHAYLYLLKLNVYDKEIPHYKPYWTRFNLLNLYVVIESPKKDQNISGIFNITGSIIGDVSNFIVNLYSSKGGEIISLYGGQGEVYNNTISILDTRNLMDGEYFIGITVITSRGLPNFFRSDYFNIKNNNSCGDINNNGQVSLGDIIYLVNYMFNKPKDNCTNNCWPITPVEKADVNGNGIVSLGDIIHLINYMFNKPGDWTLKCTSGNVLTTYETSTKSTDQIVNDLIKYGSIQQSTCSDSTVYSTCSTTKPKYCSNGALINSCQSCGCPTGQLCQTDGTCVTPTCSDGTVYNSCSATKPKYCSSGTLINNCQSCGCPTGQSCQSDGSCAVPTCSDGTLYNSCSSTKPQYCSSSGSLTNKCSTCGCNTGETCQADGTCKPKTCGNNVVDVGEECDGTQLGGKTCQTLNQGYTGGTLSCKIDCTFDTTQCTSTQKCSDGTFYGQCNSLTKKYCSNGVLINQCSTCGCLSGQTCQADGSCIVPTCSDGTQYNSCSITKPLYCIKGNLANKCSTCGCPKNQVCLTDGRCRTTLKSALNII